MADATLRVFVRWYPPPLRPLVNLLVRALLDDAVLDAFGYRRPSRRARYPTGAGVPASDFAPRAAMKRARWKSASPSRRSTCVMRLK